MPTAYHHSRADKRAPRANEPTPAVGMPTSPVRPTAVQPPGLVVSPSSRASLVKPLRRRSLAWNTMVQRTEPMRATGKACQAERLLGFCIWAATPLRGTAKRWQGKASLRSPLSHLNNRLYLFPQALLLYVRCGAQVIHANSQLNRIDR